MVRNKTSKPVCLWLCCSHNLLTSKMLLLGGFYTYLVAVVGPEELDPLLPSFPTFPTLFACTMVKYNLGF